MYGGDIEAAKDLPSEEIRSLVKMRDDLIEQILTAAWTKEWRQKTIEKVVQEKIKPYIKAQENEKKKSNVKKASAATAEKQSPAIVQPDVKANAKVSLFSILKQSYLYETTLRIYVICSLFCCWLNFLMSSCICGNRRKPKLRRLIRRRRGKKDWRSKQLRERQLCQKQKRHDENNPVPISHKKVRDTFGTKKAL